MCTVVHSCCKNASITGIKYNSYTTGKYLIHRIRVQCSWILYVYVLRTRMHEITFSILLRIHKYLQQFLSFCRVRVSISQWCRDSLLCDRWHVIEYVDQTCVCLCSFAFALRPQRWIRVHNPHFGLTIPTVFLPKSLHHVRRLLVPLRSFGQI